jgi:hypothetical protein
LLGESPNIRRYISPPSSGWNIKARKTPVETLQTQNKAPFTVTTSARTQFQTVLPIFATYLKGLAGEKFFTIQRASLVWQGIKQTVNP